ncbi:MAG: transcription elongation factor GreA [Candidatus Absconditabacterales bacterium]
MATAKKKPTPVKKTPASKAPAKAAVKAKASPAPAKSAKLTTKAIVKPAKQVPIKEKKVPVQVSTKQVKALIKEETVPKKEKKEEIENDDNETQAEDTRMSFELDDDIVPADESEEEDGFVETKKKEISRTGYDKLIEELKDLEEVQIPSVNARIKEAREFGDLSENAEYQSALNEKQMLETRISELKEAIALSVVVDTAKNSDTVQYGSTVAFEFLDTRETTTVVIIGSAEITYEEQVRHISFDSPIGTALEGKKVGDVCKVRAEKGRFDIKIMSIK